MREFILIDKETFEEQWRAFFDISTEKQKDWEDAFRNYLREEDCISSENDH